jgi:hypothetical protein
MPTRTLASLVVAMVIPGSVAAGCGEETHTSCMGPMLTISVGRHSYDEGTCSGHYSLQGPATVKVEQTITAEIPENMDVSSAWPLPVSADPETVRLESRTGDGRRERFRAVAPGQTMLNVWGFFCPYTPAPTPSAGGPSGEPAVPRHRCDVLAVHVVPG